ncbi:MAG TPA: hypothetical protein VJ483_10220 [Holophagaceae bacterium]|nr:hypothetical protein [Holophagaceae bacterium]
MDRFGSSKLRIVWTLVFLFLAGLVFMAVKADQGVEGHTLMVLGSSLPIGDDTVAKYGLGNLVPMVYTAVPLVMVLGAFGGLAPWVTAPARGERMKGLFLGSLLAFLHGLFLSQVMLLPIWAAAQRFTGSPFPAELVKADLLALVLGLQLLLWSNLLMRLLRSNPGLGLLLALVLRDMGSRLQYFADFGADLGMTPGMVKALSFLMHLLPSGQLPSDPFSLMALPLSIGGPLLLGFLLMIPNPGAGAKAPSPKKPKA